MNQSTRKSVQVVSVCVFLLIAETAVSTEDENLKRLIKPQSTVNFGVGYLFDDNARFGQYSGVRNENPYGIFNVDLTKRDDGTGTWLKLSGRNLGFQNRDVRFEHNKQGHWSYFIDFNQTPRYEPFTVVTAVTGIGSAHLNVPTSPTTGESIQLKTERQTITFGMNRLLPGNFELQLHFRNEEKDGTRIFGRGNRLGPPIPGIGGGYEFLPEPIDYSTRQFGGTLNYNGQRLQLSGGYYGTMFVNKNTALHTMGGSSAGGIYAPNVYTPLALPPDNQSHQVFLSGGYSFTSTLHGTFKAAHTRATQTDSFFSTQLPALGIGKDLDGRIDTTFVQAGATARPVSQLSVLATVRFEDRDDNTPVRLYNPMAGQPDLNGNRWSGFNHPRSFSNLTSKLEANYTLPMKFRLIGSVDYEHWDRRWQPTFVGHRVKTDEISYRAEIRRILAETLTGSIAYVHSNRFGSPFISTMTVTGDAYSNLIAPLNLSDRSRDKVRLSLNWEPIESLSLQVMADESFDDYEHRSGANLGLRNGSARNYALDAVYTISDNLQAVAWFSRNETYVDQASRNWNPADGSRENWSANLQNIGTSFGIDINGKPTDKLETGASISHTFIADKFKQRTSDPATYSVPDISTELSNIRLFARYALRKNLSLHLDYILNRFKTDEWTWNHWIYTDGTRLMQDNNQIASFVGLSAHYFWQ